MQVVPKFRPPILPAKTRQCRKKTLVLDLDETLVHSSLEAVPSSDFTFPVHFNNQEHMIHVKQRPGLHVFLQRVSELFEVVVFTASQKIYAERLLNIIDPQRKCVQHSFCTWHVPCALPGTWMQNLVHCITCARALCRPVRSACAHAAFVALVLACISAHAWPGLGRLQQGRTDGARCAHIAFACSCVPQVHQAPHLP